MEKSNTDTKYAGGERDRGGGGLGVTAKQGSKSQAA